MLLDRPEEASGRWTCYVGRSVAVGGVKGRLTAHAKDSSKRNWYRALAIRPSDTTWNEAEVQWLEGQLHHFLDDANGVSLSNTQVPGGGGLQERHQIPLRRVEAVLRGVLTLIGHPVGVSSRRREPPPQPPRTPKSPTRRTTLADLVAAGLLTRGATLVPVDPRWPGDATVTDGGGLRVADVTYTSPSRAAQALSGRKAESGWTFWAIDTAQGPTLENLRTRLKSATEEPLVQRPVTPPSALPEAASVVGQGGIGLLGQMVAAGFVPANARLSSTSKKWPAEARVVADGRMETRAGTFDSPSAAAESITGTSVNGWKFWAIRGPKGKTLAALRDEFRASKRAS